MTLIYELKCDNFILWVFSLQQLLLPMTQVATPMCSVVTMVNVFLTATDVMVIKTVEITVMKTDVVGHIMVCIV